MYFLEHSQDIECRPSWIFKKYTIPLNLYFVITLELFLIESNKKKLLKQI